MKNHSQTQMFVLVLSIISLFLVIAVAGCQRTGQPGSENLPAVSRDIILATTTSTQDSGLLDLLLPEFEKKTGWHVKTIAVGTGQALAMGERGEADVLLVHAPEEEKKLVEKGVAINYRLLMYNDFVVVGPPHDPAGVSKAKSASEALKKIAEKRSLFVSRGDGSGTHVRECQLWRMAGMEPPVGESFYQETGQGMAQTLRIASEKEGYTLSDRAVYLTLRGTLDLAVLFEGGAELRNVYHVMQVNPEKFLRVNGNGGKALVEFLIAPETQKMISEFGVEKFGQPLFYPLALAAE